MKKLSTVVAGQRKNFQGPKLTIGFIPTFKKEMLYK